MADTGLAKKGMRSVGVACQYCHLLGKQDNCQVTVGVLLACDQGSFPVAWLAGIAPPCQHSPSQPMFF